MPGPVCVRDSSSSNPVFDCEPVEITGEAHPIGPPPAPAGAPPPAVKLLVDAVAGRVEIPGTQAPIVNNLEKCLGEFDALTVGLLAGAKTATLGVLGFFKLGYDIGKCEGKERVAVSNELTEAKAEKYCVEDGGTPRRWVGDTLQCVYPEVEP
jgi:hypothetical protein